MSEKMAWQKPELTPKLYINEEIQDEEDLETLFLLAMNFILNKFKSSVRPSINSSCTLEFNDLSENEKDTFVNILIDLYVSCENGEICDFSLSNALNILSSPFPEDD